MTAPRTLQPSTATAPPRAGRAILGGSFNPPHVGHLRLAIEAAEALSSLTDGVDLIPCAVPPHKAMTGMLPFDLRARMLEASIADLPFLRCNRLEGQRQGPSYTWDTLLAYREAAPDTELYFILGSPDFALLPTWHRGLELPACVISLLCRATVRTAATWPPRPLACGPRLNRVNRLWAKAPAWLCPAGAWRIFCPCPGWM